MEAKGPRCLGAEVLYTRRAVRAQEVEAGSRPLSPAPQKLPWHLTAGLQIMQKCFRNHKAGLQRLPTEHFMVLEWDRERLKL